MIKIAALLACALLLAPAYASDESDSDVTYEALRDTIDIGRGAEFDEERVLLSVRAIGWLGGVYDTLGMNAQAGSLMRICSHGSVSAETMARVYTSYMDAHPESHSMPNLSVAIVSAMQAYPCKA